MDTQNKTQLWRYVSILQMLAGIVLLAVSYQMGKAHFSLIRNGVKTPGKIIGYQQWHVRKPAWTSGKSVSAMMPLVEYKVNDRVIHFTDWKGTNGGELNEPVTVLYDPLNPAVAMIDRPVWNWMPWAPIFVVGAFLVIMGVSTRLREPSRLGRGIA